jgi:hypothetical protein
MPESPKIATNSSDMPGQSDLAPASSIALMEKQAKELRSKME